jgi:integrase
MARKSSKKGTGGRKAAGRANGQGSLELHGKHWRAKWMVDGKVYRRTTGTSDEREAKKKLAEFVAPFRLTRTAKTESKTAKAASRSGLSDTAAALAAAARRTRAEAGRLAVPLSKAWDKFAGSLTRKPVSPATMRMYEGVWDAFLRWMRENRSSVVGVADVDGETAQEFMRDVKARWSPKTFNNYRALLAMVWAVLDKEGAGLDGANPWHSISPMERDTHVRRELTVEELARVVEPLDGEMRVLFAIGIYTGLRLGDCVNLDWGAVDLVRGFIQWTPRKTKKHGTVVRIPLFPALRTILSETPANKRRGLILPELAEEYGRSSSYTSERVKHVFEDAGIDTQGDTGRANPTNTKTTRKAVEVGFHSLRHTFVSMAANAGVPLHIVQSIVGHTNTAMTGHYFHVSDDALRGAVGVLPDVYAKTALPPAQDVQDIEAEVVPTPSPSDAPQRILEALEGMDAKNWKQVRDEVVRMVKDMMEETTR